MNRLVNFASRLVNSPWFEYFIIAVIVLNGVLLGLETVPALERGYGSWMQAGNQAALWVFIIEAALKLLALWPRPLRYFRDGWNVFDFLVIVFALVPATGQFAMIARLARLLRVVRLISAIQDLRLIVAALARSIPSVGHVIMLMSIVVYIYAIMGYYLFHQHDPEHWGSLTISLLTLFNIITLDGWTDIMDTAMARYPLAWVYFVSYVVVSTFVAINMFIAIIINSLDDAKRERQSDRNAAAESETPVSREQLLRELRATRDTLKRLEERLQSEEGDGGDNRSG